MSVVRLSDPAALDLGAYIRPGDGIVWGQVTGEPLAITAEIIRQRERIGPVSAFLGISFSGTVKPEHAEFIKARALGGAGANRELSKAGVLDVVPSHLSMIPQLIQSARIAADIAIVQISLAEEPGFFKYAVVSDYIVSAVEKARVVIGELNHTAPVTSSALRIPAERMACIVETERPVIAVPAARAGETEKAIAAHAAGFIEDGSVLQVGIGAVPDALMALIGDRKDLAIHSGMIGDSAVDLIENGIVTNARKPINPGVSVTGALIGTEKLYRVAHRNPALELHTVSHTHDIRILASLPKLVSMNSALEVDLTGQINAEMVGGTHIGAVGGQVDFVRGAMISPGGRSIIALPATTASGRQSRIVERLSGPVTTSRADADVVITEFGAAELRGRGLDDRARALIGIAHPAFRDELWRAYRKMST